MTKLVQKSGYIQASQAGGYMKYIATREGVEKLVGNGPATKGQRELIQQLLRDYPDAKELFEYEDYRKTPTLGTASAFITMALDANLHEIHSESGYMQYIATRPRVQRRGSHGLFSAAPSVDLDTAMSQLESHEGNVWTIIYSLRREDASRLGYDHAEAWRSLLMRHTKDLAKAMKIPADHFRWYAAFHDEGHPLSQQKEFRKIKNDVIREAENIRLGLLTFEDEAMRDEPEPDTEPESQQPHQIYEQVQRYRAAKAVLQDIYALDEEHTQAVSELEQLWEEGYTVAAHQLGKFFRDSLSTLRNHEKAEHWFRLSAEAGNDCSEYALGKLLLTQKRTTEAVQWLDKAADHGNQFAQYRLGKLYLTGEAVPKDVWKALEYLKSSAGQENQFAQYTLGKLYLLGRDVAQDREQAQEWLSRSASQGNPYAQFFLDRLDLFRDPSVTLAATRPLHHMGRIFRDNSVPPQNPAGITTTLMAPKYTTSTHDRMGMVIFKRTPKTRRGISAKIRRILAHSRATATLHIPKPMRIRLGTLRRVSPVKASIALTKATQIRTTRRGNSPQHFLSISSTFSRQFISLPSFFNHLSSSTLVPFSFIRYQPDFFTNSIHNAIDHSHAQRRS